jgi:hypothetical protein
MKLGADDQPTPSGTTLSTITNTSKLVPSNSAVSVKWTLFRLITSGTVKAGHMTMPAMLRVVKGKGVQSRVTIEAFAAMARRLSEKIHSTLRIYVASESKLISAIVSVFTPAFSSRTRSRLRLLFVAAKIWRHAGRTGVSYSDHYEEKGVFERLLERLRRIALRGEGSAPVMMPALR